MAKGSTGSSSIPRVNSISQKGRTAHNSSDAIKCKTYRSSNVSNDISSIVLDSDILYQADGKVWMGPNGQRGDCLVPMQMLPQAS